MAIWRCPGCNRRAYKKKKVLGAWKERQRLKALYGSDAWKREGECQTCGRVAPPTPEERDARRKSWEEYERRQAEQIKPMLDLVLGLIDSGYKGMAHRLHPDKGGSSAEMIRLKKVTDLLRRDALKLARAYEVPV